MNSDEVTAIGNEDRPEAGTGPEGEREETGTRYVTTWRNKFLCVDTTSYDEFLSTLAGGVAILADWKVRGVRFDIQGVCDDYATFYTFDAVLAKELGFQDEREWYGDDSDIQIEDGGDGQIEDGDHTRTLEEQEAWDLQDRERAQEV